MLVKYPQNLFAMSVGFLISRSLYIKDDGIRLSSCFPLVLTLILLRKLPCFLRLLLGNSNF